MLALLQLVHCTSLKPVILVPGTYASVLEYTGQSSQLPWYCPKKLDQAIVWVGEKYFLPPLYNCVFHWLTLHYDPTLDRQITIPGMEADVFHFGRVDGVTYLDRFTKNISFIPYFSSLVKVLRSHGYVDETNLFGAPHDWRFGIANQDILWPRLKELCEKATRHNDNKPCVLIGHSFGGWVCHYFATNIAPTFGKEWMKTYLDRVIEISPSFGGAGSAALYAYLRALKYKVEIKTKTVQQAIESLGCVHTHFPNYELMRLHGDPAFVIGPDGTQYKASEFPKLLIDREKVTEENVNLLKLTVPYLEKAPLASKAREIIFYNTAWETVCGFRVGNWEKDSTVKEIYGRGDHTVMADNIEAYCNKIADKKLTSCRDMNDPTKNGKHFGMLSDPAKLEMFYQAVIEE